MNEFGVIGWNLVFVAWIFGLHAAKKVDKSFLVDLALLGFELKIIMCIETFLINTLGLI